MKTPKWIASVIPILKKRAVAIGLVVAAIIGTWTALQATPAQWGEWGFAENVTTPAMGLTIISLALVAIATRRSRQQNGTFRNDEQPAIRSGPRSVLSAVFLALGALTYTSHRALDRSRLQKWSRSSWHRMVEYEQKTLARIASSFGGSHARRPVVMTPSLG